jgi:hypothetical protein
VRESPLRDFTTGIFDGYKETAHLLGKEYVLTIVADVDNYIIVVGVGLCLQCRDVILLVQQLVDLRLNHLVSCQILRVDRIVELSADSLVQEELKDIDRVVVPAGGDEDFLVVTVYLLR